MTSTTSQQAQAILQNQQKDLTNAQFSLNCILGAYSLGCSIGLVVARRQRKYDLKRLPIWALFASLVAAFLYHIMICVLFYVFYRLNHLALLASNTKYPEKIKIAHWVILGIIVIVAVIDWAILTDYYRKILDQSALTTNEMGVLLLRAYKTDSACTIVRWLASWETLAWDTYLVIKALKAGKDSKVPTIFLFGAGTFFFALNMMWAIYDIRWYLTEETMTDTSSSYAASISQVVFLLLTYTGLLSFCLRWGWIERGILDQNHAYQNVGENSPTPIMPSFPQILPVEVEGDSRHSWFAEADSRMIVEAANSSQPAVEADSKMLDSEAKFGDKSSNFIEERKKAHCP
ncbi:hypothetical protein N7462_008836 [Penicillium macrosclerotiorum]|uniref:uncharacterized protein n=1 Tax=Penicillium macrosclerotiorum TaxID=303699 RepID=UPI0025472145|nr:uncharacterized protein N7462_008836 [Penicillium macrosclerotiorum]KAJ5675939.1 hypothetical protein N7462_008836 [Penicillium macrosclerotiorum]